MRLIIQRVAHASVTINGKVKSSIGKGLLILVGIEDADDTTDAEWLCKKVANLRIFDDENGVMNLSVKDIDGEILIISQFTLFASTKKGNRPSFANAMEPIGAENLYELFCKKLSESGIKSVQKGIFGADMKVSLVNDGPVTVILDTKIWRKYEN